LSTYYSDYIQWSIDQKNNKNLICEICYTKKQKSKELVCHHIVPIRKSGVNIDMIMNIDNIMVLCHDCHNQIHGMAVHIDGERTQGGSQAIMSAFSQNEYAYKKKQIGRIKKEYF